MAEANRMRLGPYAFGIEAAWFRRITQSWSGPGWDFSFSGPCLNDPEGIFPLGARLLTEAAPLPIEKARDYNGVDIQLPLSYDDESGEPLFGLNVGEEHEVSGLHLRICERAGSSYRIEITATVSETVLGHPERLEVSAWTEELPDHAYPA